MLDSWYSYNSTGCFFISKIVVFKGAVRRKKVVPLSQTFCLLTQKAFSLNPAEAAGSAHSMLRLDATPPKRNLKPWQNKNDLNDITAALFSVCFFAAGSWEKDTENGAAVTSSRTFVRSNAFSFWLQIQKI